MYTTTEEGADRALKGINNDLIPSDIKITLSGNTDRLDDLAKGFNESLSVIEEKKKELMRTKKSVQALPPILEGAAGGLGNRKPTFFSSRPVSAVTTRSIESKDGLYKNPPYLNSRAMQANERSRRQMPGYQSQSKQQTSISQYSQSTHSYSHSL